MKLSYLLATDLLPLIQPETGIGLLSAQGSIRAVEHDNVLIVRDTAEKLIDIRRLVAALDVPLKHVQIEARIALADDAFVRDLRARNIGVNSSVVNLNGNYNVDAELQAAQTRRQAEIVSSPRIITVNRQEAVIEQGLEIPASGTVPASHIKLRIAMTPLVRPDSQISMSVDVLRSISSTGDTEPGDQRMVSTQVLTKDGQSVVFGSMLAAIGRDDQSSPGMLAGKHVLIFLTTKSLRQEVARTN
jgi:type IV pilus assembly protein PilQ